MGIGSIAYSIIFASNSKRKMRLFIRLLLCSILVSSCDDGDIVDVNLDAFDQVLERCEETSEQFLIYNINEGNTESLTLLFPSNGNTREIFNPSENGQVLSLTIDQTSNRFNYRTYNGNPESLICNLLADPGTTIVNDYEAATSATVFFTSVFEDDDNDGVPSVLEGRDELDSEGNPRDSDDDGLPDYQDADDDNDNVLTINEGVEIDENGILIARDTDGDTIPDYLDDDDDGDEILTKNEDENGNLTLTDDFDEDSPNINVPRYLDREATESFVQDSLKTTQFSRSVIVGIVIENADIQILQTDEIIMGTYEAPTLIFEYDQTSGTINFVEN